MKGAEEERCGVGGVAKARVDVKFAAPRGIDGLRFHASGTYIHIYQIYQIYQFRQ